MKITKISTPVGTFRDATTTLMDDLIEKIRDSRFTAELSYFPKGINIGKVRLKKSKEYCGNHAKACENPGRKDRKGSFLEGADWVEFNDLLNEVCDRMKYSANIASAKGAGCIVRKGEARRIKYDSDTFVGRPGNGEWRWNYDGPPEHFRKCFENPLTISEFPPGTPGIYKNVYNVVG